MKPLDSACPPILSCTAARELEAHLFGGDEAREWAAMQSAGLAIADAVLHDFEEIGGFPRTGRILVLVGKGHNGGDALIAAHAILGHSPEARAGVVFTFGERTLRPLAARAWRELQHGVGERVAVVTLPDLRAPLSRGDTRLGGHETGSVAKTQPSPIGATDDPLSRGVACSAGVGGYDLCLDGIFGFQFRPPADARITDLISRVNDMPIRLRAGIDLPSAGLFRADFTYATGSVKAPLLESDAAGRIRYLDLGFFDASVVAEVGDLGAPSSTSLATAEVQNRVLTDASLDDLRALRPARCDKRSYGHVFLLGGSRGFPGAIFMAVEAAIRSGAGLVTAFVPESLAPSYAARLPEAIWVGWPETPAGGLALEGEHLLRERVERADALVVGPGIGREPETLALAASIVRTSTVPLVIDADALQREIVKEGSAPRVITPHAGEFKRIAGDVDLRTFADDPKLTVVLKGPVTQLCNAGPVYHSFFGGPVLARGGSGDLLAGMIGTQLAQTPNEPLAAAARAVAWHGQAAERLARARGQVAVHTTELLDYLGAVLRS